MSQKIRNLSLRSKTVRQTVVVMLLKIQSCPSPEGYGCFSNVSSQKGIILNKKIKKYSLYVFTLLLKSICVLVNGSLKYPNPITCMPPQNVSVWRRVGGEAKGPGVCILNVLLFICRCFFIDKIGFSYWQKISWVPVNSLQKQTWYRQYLDWSWFEVKRCKKSFYNMKQMLLKKTSLTLKGQGFYKRKGHLSWLVVMRTGSKNFLYTEHIL